jgi:hypothetical protein
MMKLCLLFLVCGVGVALASITGTNPASGSCLCMDFDAVNVRDSACGNILGMVNSGACFVYSGVKQTCVMSGTSYEYFQFDYGGTAGWAAGDFMSVGSAAQCSVSSEGYTCPIANGGMRVHEMTTPTPYDCVDNSCGNTCQGGQCVALITCSCKRNGQWPPGTQCWRPGTKLRSPDGTCNRSVPSGTAIATFDSNGNYYAGHTAIFVGCDDNYTIRVWDQWCCRSIGYSTYSSSHSYFSTFAVLTNPSCADRSSWPCRFEASGPTCCPTSVAACRASDDYWNVNGSN